MVVYRKFVETFKPYKTEKICLSDFFRKKDTLRYYVRKTLNELLYHNLAKISNIYKDAIEVDLGDISELIKAVDIRHDIVHRNGDNLEGVPHIITPSHVQIVQE